MTEWHRAGLLAPQEMAGRTPPCAEHRELAVLGGGGEHLCRVCLNCGYGWPEACTGQAAAPRRVPLPPPAAWALLLSLASGLAGTAAGSAVSLLFTGTARVIAWLAAVVAVSAAAGVGYAAVDARRSQNVTGDRTEKGCRL